MSQRTLTVMYYVPSEAFRLIPEHVCVARLEDRVPVALCGPSDDPASQFDAQRFAAADRLVEALVGIMWEGYAPWRRCRECFRMEHSGHGRACRAARALEAAGGYDVRFEDPAEDVQLTLAPEVVA